jgi:iron complex outermembrane receptor protein
MGNAYRKRIAGRIAVACAMIVLSGCAAAAQSTILLPTIDVLTSRLGTGIVGTSTSVITAEEIARSPAQTIPDLLSQQPGIQARNLFGSANAASTTVDMRGFGATASNNTLVLVNGRRLNDIDLAGVDFSAIPKESIERIEITRGNSGAVLYGDGAVGGTINIVTKSGVGLPPSLRADTTAGSYNYRAANVAMTSSTGPLSMSAFGEIINSDGYRFNNDLRQRNIVTDWRYRTDMGTTVYVNLSADSQILGLPGGRLVTPTFSLLDTDPRGAATPFDYGKKQGLSATAGVARMLAPGTELIVDGGIRQKKQQSAFFSAFGAFFDTALDTTLTTYSVTPRINSAHDLAGMPSKLIAGIDFYFSDYNSDRMAHTGDPPNHHYLIRQRTLAAYFQETIGVRPDTDVAVGGRLQRNWISARDRFDAFAPGGFFAAPEGTPLDSSEYQYAAHLGIDHRINQVFAVFARVAHSFRLPNVDERVAQGPFGVPTTFDLRTQTSHDAEAGVRVMWNGFTLQSSAYVMNLTDEIFFSPATFTNVNLDPTRRAGVENTATLQVSKPLRLRGGLAYTRATFREGPFAGNDIPLVARWTGMAGFSWDVLPDKRLLLDMVARYVGEARMDNDSANVQPLIPAHTTVDVHIGGEVDRFNWSLTVQNLFDVAYFEYAIASAFALGTYNAYPLPGRTIFARLGVKLP